MSKYIFLKVFYYNFFFYKNYTRIVLFVKYFIKRCFI